MDGEKNEGTKRRRKKKMKHGRWEMNHGKWGDAKLKKYQEPGTIKIEILKQFDGKTETESWIIKND